MSVDARVREGLTMIDKKLPTVDTVEGYENLELEVRRRTHRRRALVGVAAAAVLVVTTGAMLLNRNNQSSVQPAQSPNSAAFRSPLYGYSIALPQGWEAVAATQYPDAPKSTEQTSSDSFRVPGTDTTIRVTADYLGGGTYATWANAYHQSILADAAVPSGCDGGDPSSWRRLQIGTGEGYLLQKCNEAIGVMPVGKRVYLFIWGNRTFVEGHHYPQSRFEKLLAGVTLPDPTTANEPLTKAASSQGG